MKLTISKFKTSHSEQLSW